MKQTYINCNAAADQADGGNRHNGRNDSTGHAVCLQNAPMSSWPLPQDRWQQTACCNRCRNTLPFGCVKRPGVLSFSELVIAEASAGALVGGSVSSSVPISSTVGGLLGSSCLSTYLYTWQRVNHSKPHCAHPHNPRLSRNEQTQIIQNHTDVCM